MMQTQQANSIDMEAVSRKAYELWVQGGRRDGVAEQNWIEAERLVRASQAPKAQQAFVAPKSEPASSPRSSSAPPSAPTNSKKSMKRH